MDVLKAIKIRRSVRNYKPDPIPQPVLEKLMEAIRFAPSACNNQPWKFVFVSDPELKQKLATAARDQKFIAEAPLIVVGCGFPDKAYHYMGGYGNSIEIDIAIALDHLTLAAAAEGIGTCWIGAFDETAVKKILNIPANAKVVALTPLGYPAKKNLLCPCPDSRRKSPEDIFSREKL